MSALDDWITDASEALGVPPDVMTRDLRDQLLDLTRDVAHGVARVAGPLTTFLVGIAVGAGAPAPAAVRRLAELAASRSSEDGADQAGDGSTANAGDGSADQAGGSSTANAGDGSAAKTHDAAAARTAHGPAASTADGAPSGAPA